MNLESDRILLRHWKESDANDLYYAASNPNIGLNAGWTPHKDINESLEIIKTIFNMSQYLPLNIRKTKKLLDV